MNIDQPLFKTKTKKHLKKNGKIFKNRRRPKHTESVTESYEIGSTLSEYVCIANYYGYVSS